MITSPVSRAMLQPLGREEVVQFPHPLTDREYRKVAKLVDGHPNVTLRAYGSKFTDLDFLRFFPEVRQFQADYMYQLESMEGLRHLPADLDSLVLGETKTARQFSLTFLREFRNLRKLYLEKHTKDIDVVGELSNLEELTLRSITLPDLSILLPLANLLSLDLKLGGTRKLSQLPNIGRLRYLELWQIRGLEDIAAVGEVTTLQYLFLQSLRRVERLPDLGRLTKLRRVVLDNMKGLSDLSPLATAPALEQLHVIDMRHINLEQLKCLIGHPTLHEATFGLGNLKRNAEAQELVGVPTVTTPFEFV
jgi:internalin A